MKGIILKSVVLATLAMISFVPCGARSKVPIAYQPWSIEKANQWYARQPWYSGCNFQPSTAINQIEMWQNESFDMATIDKELGWAQELGFNVMRVFLSSVVWENEPVVFKKNINRYLDVSSKHGIKTIFVFFDDCWNTESRIGKQPDPKPCIHNSGWVQDPSVSLRKDTTKLFPKLEAYVKDIIGTFKNDKRILMWDLYNEPGNSGHVNTTLPLLRNVFKWARETSPSQPLTSGIYDSSFREICTFQATHSDVITYHNYADKKEHKIWMELLQTHNRPMICTEYMSRRSNSTFKEIMPMLKENKVGAINWGFVSGKTNTIFAWDNTDTSRAEPKLWFHDILRRDHSAFDDSEVKLIKELNRR